MLYDTVENMIISNEAPAQYPDLCNDIMKVFAMECPFTESEYSNMSREEKIDKLHEAATKQLDRKSDKIREVAMPVITKMAEEHPEYDGLILVPMTDGKRIFRLRTDLREAIRTEGRAIIKEWHKALMLVTIDELWKEHLRELDQLRQSVQNAAYEQKDPLVIYKVESFHLFESMLSNLNAKAISALMRGQIYAPQPRPQQDEPAPEKKEPDVREAQPEPLRKKAFPAKASSVKPLRHSRASARSQCR